MPAPSTIPETDFSLLRRFAEDGDEDAFSEIVRRYAGVVFSACHRVLRDRGQGDRAGRGPACCTAHAGRCRATVRFT